MATAENQMLDLRVDRNRVSTFTVGFLNAFKAAILPYYSLEAEEAPPQLVQCSLAHMQVFAVRAMETYFRDCFVFLCERDPAFLAAAAESTKGKIDFATAGRFLNGQSSYEEHLAFERNFQSLDVVNVAFEPFLGRKMFDALELLDTNPYIPDGPLGGIKIGLKGTGWRSKIYDLVESRHQIIHNANHPLEFDQAIILEQFENALLIGQLFGMVVAQKLQVGQLLVEVPLWVLIYLSAAMNTKMSPGELLVNVLREANKTPELREKSGHVGPVLVQPVHLKRLDFQDDSMGGKSVGIYHIISKVGDRYELRSLHTLPEARGHGVRSLKAEIGPASVAGKDLSPFD